MPSTNSKYQKASSKQIKKKPRPASMGGASVQAADPDASLQGAQQPNCAWQAYITGKMWNVAYPDSTWSLDWQAYRDKSVGRQPCRRRRAGLSPPSPFLLQTPCLDDDVQPKPCTRCWSCSR